MKVVKRRNVVVVALALVAAGTLPIALHDANASSCKLHPEKVLNPGCLPSTSEDLEPTVTLPDLRPNVVAVQIAPMFTFEPVTQTWTTSPPYLWFDTRAENRSSVPFELFVEDVDVQATSSTSQCISWTLTYVCRQRVVVGGFAWHEEHKHFHYQDFAKYELRNLGVDGRPDYSESGRIAASEKVSFCLVDSEALTTPPSPATYPPLCTATRQGVSPGWADVYANDLPGQQFSVEGVPDGRYALIVTIDPPGRLHEADRSNNRLEAIIEISGERTTVAIVGRDWR